MVYSIVCDLYLPQPNTHFTSFPITFSLTHPAPNTLAPLLFLEQSLYVTSSGPSYFLIPLVRKLPTGIYSYFFTFFRIFPKYAIRSAIFPNHDIQNCNPHPLTDIYTYGSVYLQFTLFLLLNFFHGPYYHLTYLYFTFD